MSPLGGVWAYSRRNNRLGGIGMAGAKDRGPRPHERRLMESESRWLQKALFALGKAEDDRDKLDAALDAEVEPIKVEIKGKSFDMATVSEAMTEAIRERSESLRQSLGRGHAALR